MEKPERKHKREMRDEPEERRSDTRKKKKEKKKKICCRHVQAGAREGYLLVLISIYLRSEADKGREEKKKRR